jgi:hypothetical protein
MEGNINDVVWVKLTKDGKKVHNEHYAEVFKDSRVVVDLKEYKPKISILGYTQYQLHEIAHIFGKVLYNGSMISPFKKNRIWFTNPNS